MNILKRDKFIKKNTEVWQELESLASRINKKGIKKLNSADVKKFQSLFRKSSHHLAYARTHYPDSNITKYLNSLIGKCHNHIYVVKKISIKDLFNYIVYGFPQILKEIKAYIIISFAFFALGSLISLLMVMYNPENAQLFLPDNFIEAIQNPTSNGGQWNYPLMSSYIMVNNIGVALRSFVFGITLGLGTIYVLFINGALLGALTALVYLYGEPVNYWSLILPHGIIELVAIFIAGAAGLIIAKYILIPGKYSRKNALIKGSKKAVSLIGGITFFLIIAGIIEGFFTPLEVSSIIKLIFATFTGLILIVYFTIPYINKNNNYSSSYS